MFKIEIDGDDDARARAFPSRAKAIEWFRIFAYEDGRLVHPDGSTEPLRLFRKDAADDDSAWLECGRVGD